MLRVSGPILLTLLATIFALDMAGAERPKVIYGEDNRVDYFEVTDPVQRELANSTVALVRAHNVQIRDQVAELTTESYSKSYGLCTQEPYYEQETAAFCSGFLVAPDVIVTAGHCVTNSAACERTRFVFGFRLNSPGEQPRAVPAEHVFSCKNLIHSVARGQGEDFAVVRLDRPVTHVAPLAYRISGRPQAGEALEVMGHPAGLPLKVASGASVRHVHSEYLVANLDTYGGNSGSAVFNAVTHEVEGVLVRGEADFEYKSGCATSKRCDNQGCRGEDVTLFERVLPYLQ